MWGCCGGGVASFRSFCFGLLLVGGIVLWFHVWFLLFLCSGGRGVI